MTICRRGRNGSRLHSLRCLQSSHGCRYVCHDPRRVRGTSALRLWWCFWPGWTDSSWRAPIS